MSTMKIAKQGTFLRVTSGKYYEREVFGLFLVLRDFDPYAMLDKYLKNNPRANERYQFYGLDYVIWLVEKGLLQEQKCSNLHTDDYGDVSEFEFTPDEP